MARGKSRLPPGRSRPRTRRAPHIALRIYGVTEGRFWREICDIRQVSRWAKNYWQVNLHLG